MRTNLLQLAQIANAIHDDEEAALRLVRMILASHRVRLAEEDRPRIRYKSAA